MWFRELDAQRWETRNVDVFRDRRREKAGLGEETTYVVLRPKPLPSIAEITAQDEFDAEEIDAAEFEMGWMSASPLRD
jgi:uncharacterized protein DUF6881